MPRSRSTQTQGAIGSRLSDRQTDASPGRDLREARERVSPHVRPILEKYRGRREAREGISGDREVTPQVPQVTRQGRDYCLHTHKHTHTHTIPPRGGYLHIQDLQGNETQDR